MPHECPCMWMCGPSWPFFSPPSSMYISHSYGSTSVAFSLFLSISLSLSRTSIFSLKPDVQRALFSIISSLFKSFFYGLLNRNIINFTITCFFVVPFAEAIIHLSPAGAIGNEATSSSFIYIPGKKTVRRQQKCCPIADSSAFHMHGFYFKFTFFMYLWKSWKKIYMIKRNVEGVLFSRLRILNGYFLFEHANILQVSVVLKTDKLTHIYIRKTYNNSKCRFIINWSSASVQVLSMFQCTYTCSVR